MHHLKQDLKEALAELTGRLQQLLEERDYLRKEVARLEAECENRGYLTRRSESQMEELESKVHVVEETLQVKEMEFESDTSRLKQLLEQCQKEKQACQTKKQVPSAQDSSSFCSVISTFGSGA